MNERFNRRVAAHGIFAALVFALSLITMSCAHPKPMPSQASVDAIMQTFAKLEHAFGLCIIDGCPTRVGSSNPFSLEEAQAHIAQGKEDLAFLNGIKSGKIFDEVNACAGAYRQSSTQVNADKLFESLELCITLVKKDLQVPLWQKRVTPKLSHQTEILVEYLNYQFASLSSGNALVSSDTSPKKPHPSPTQAQVEQAIDVLSSLEQALRLCIQDVTVPNPDMTRHYTQNEVQQMLELSLKEKEFRKSVRFISSIVAVLNSEKSYLTSPSPAESEKLFGLFQEFINDVRTDSQLPIWKELVSQAHTDLVLEYASNLEQRLNQAASTE